MDAAEVERQFKEQSRKPSRKAADAMLARGRSIAFRKVDTPPEHVIVRHPDGRTELVHVRLGSDGSDALGAR